MGLTISRWDHPRIRGEHKSRGVWPVGADGSSPHTRGAPVDVGDHLPQLRIIPAYAGSTVARRASIGPSEDHPRIRGEHERESPLWRLSPGSSPHTRGARHPPPVLALLRRIIPAYAGSTGGGGWRRPDRTDHPRIRGEHRVEPHQALTTAGSSPHTRGARRPHPRGA